MPKKMSLLGNASKEFPTLLNTQKGPVLAVDVNTYLAVDGDGFSWFGDQACTDRWASSQQDRDKVTRLVQTLDEVGVFNSADNECVPRCLELSYLIELAGSRPEFWQPAMSAWVDEFLDQVFPGLTGYSVDDALNAVKPLSEWPADRKPGTEKLSLIVQAGPVKAGMLSFTTRSIVFYYKCNGSVRAQYLGFQDYKELSTELVNRYEWYSACWKHLYYQLLAACGIRCDDLQFICAEGFAPFENYQYDGPGEEPSRASNPAYVLERLEKCLNILRV